MDEKIESRLIDSVLLSLGFIRRWNMCLLNIHLNLNLNFFRDFKRIIAKIGRKERFWILF